MDQSHLQWMETGREGDERGGITSYPGVARPMYAHVTGSPGPTVSTAKGAIDDVCAATPFLEWGFTFKT